MKSKYMSPELQQKLFEQFPWIKPDESDRQSPWTLFGFEIDDGWFSLLQGLFIEIKELYKSRGLPVNLKIGQIKEKFGELMVYFDFETEDLYEEVLALALKYRQLSKSVCYVCGGQASQHKILNWFVTLCDPCYNTYNEQARW